MFLHGYGADGNDLIDIGRMFAPILPDTAFVSPARARSLRRGADGPAVVSAGAAATSHAYWRGVEQAAPALDAFLDAELARLRLTDRDLALVGFSQGTMMALHVGLRRKAPIAGIVGYSGLLAGPEHLEDAGVHKAPILLVHGDADPLIPVVALHAAVQALGAAGFLTEWHVSPGLAHGIDEDGLRLGADFLRRVLAG